jgi:hypothetical protein
VENGVNKKTNNAHGKGHEPNRAVNRVLHGGGLKKTDTRQCGLNRWVCNGTEDLASFKHRTSRIYFFLQKLCSFAPKADARCQKGGKNHELYAREKRV